MTLLLLAGVIVAIGLVVAHELGVIERTSRSSVTLAEECERQRRARIEADR